MTRLLLALTIFVFCDMGLIVVSSAKEPCNLLSSAAANEVDVAKNLKYTKTATATAIKGTITAAAMVPVLDNPLELVDAGGVLEGDDEGSLVGRKLGCLDGCPLGCPEGHVGEPVG